MSWYDLEAVVSERDESVQAVVTSGPPLGSFVISLGVRARYDYDSFLPSGSYSSFVFLVPSTLQIFPLVRTVLQIRYLFS